MLPESPSAGEGWVSPRGVPGVPPTQHPLPLPPLLLALGLGQLSVSGGLLWFWFWSRSRVHPVKISFRHSTGGGKDSVSPSHCLSFPILGHPRTFWGILKHPGESRTIPSHPGSPRPTPSRSSRTFPDGVVQQDVPSGAAGGVPREGGPSGGLGGLGAAAAQRQHVRKNPDLVLQQRRDLTVVLLHPL